MDRFSKRWVHEPSGRTYHEIENPPNVPFKDDKTGEPLTQKEENTEEVL